MRTLIVQHQKILKKLTVCIAICLVTVLSINLRYWIIVFNAAAQWLLDVTETTHLTLIVVSFPILAFFFLGRLGIVLRRSIFSQILSALGQGTMFWALLVIPFTFLCAPAIVYKSLDAQFKEAQSSLVERLHSISNSAAAYERENQRLAALNQSNIVLLITQNYELDRLRPNSSATQKSPPNLLHYFPFGYGIYSRRDGKLNYTPPKSDGLNVQINWAEVDIVPDFSARTIKWTIPWGYEDVERHLIAGGNIFHATTDMNIGSLFVLFRVPAPGPNRPTVVGALLDDNQRTPTFVLGLRIIDDSSLTNLPNKRP